MRPLFADPKTDVVFKRIFGVEGHKDLLIALLNSLLKLDESRRIVDLTHLTPEQTPVVRDLKSSIVDVKCLDAQGTRYVVEMQVLQVEGFEKRVVYNLCKAYSTQLAGGDDYPELNDVVAVTICDFELWPEAEPPHVPMLSRWAMREESTGARRLQQLRFVFLELPKYRAGDAPQTPEDKWAYFFRETRHLRAIPAPLAAEPYHRALEVARSAGFTPEEWEAYDRAKVAEQDARGALAFATQQGRQEGRAEGRAEGRQEGRAEGRQEGRAEGQRALLVRAFELRFGELDTATRAALETLPTDRIERCLVRAMTATSAAEALAAV
jgi:predicted transposase/invertase (TIGR01784 family)